MKKQILGFTLGLALFGAVVSASAQIDVLSLQDSPQQDYTYYSYDVTATNTTTWLTVFFRQDPAYWGFDDVALTDTNGNNLIVNGGFETGDLTGWETVGQQGLPAAGRVTAGTPGPGTENSHSGSYYWYDGAVGGVDGIAQGISTVVGQDYVLSFWLAGDGEASGDINSDNYASFDAFIGAQVSTYNGIPILYNGEQPTGGGGVTTPEPSVFALTGLGGLGWLLFRRRKS
jgi:hypothetical protein